MRTWIIRLLVLVAIASAVVFLRQRLLAVDPLEVQVSSLERGRVEATITNSRAGTVTARRRAKLSPEIGGTVVALPFREGEPVKASDIVLRLDDSLHRARLEVAQRDAKAARAEQNRACLAAERTVRERERIEGLRTSGIVSDDQLDAVDSASQTAEAACRTAGATAAKAASAIALARAELAKTVIRSPFDGVVAELTTELGEYVTPSPPAVPVPAAVDILDPASIYVRAPMDEVDAASIRPGQPARITVDSHRGESFPGRVERVAPYVLDREQQNRTVDIDVAFDDPDLGAVLLPGTSADVEVVLETRDDVLRIPSGALIEGRKVFVLEGDALRSAEVEVGLRNWAWTEITGLDEGALVVTRVDHAEIQDGRTAIREVDPAP